MLGYASSRAIDDARRNRAPPAHSSLDPTAERGISDLHVCNRFIFSTIYDSPGNNGYAQQLEVCQLNSIFVLRGGRPRATFDFGDDLRQTAEFANRSDLKPGVNLKNLP